VSSHSDGGQPWDLNSVLAAYLGEPGDLGGPTRVESMVGATASPRAVALCEQATECLSQVPPVLSATWPVERTLDLACEIAAATFPILTRESLALLRRHWAFTLR
jgi:hypothetical protein